MAKILLVASAGGHFSELKKIEQKPEHQYTIVTEKNSSSRNDQTIDYFLLYGSRSQIFKYFGICIINLVKAFWIICKTRPNIIISTGAHSCVPFIYIGKLFRIKTIYIESYAKVQTVSMTYKIIKPVVDKVIFQHQKLAKENENSLFLGGIY